MNENEPTVINVGPLSSIASLYFHCGKGLQEYSKAFLQKKNKQLVWDLRSLESGHISIAALSSFLALADRARKFNSSAPNIIVRWNPEVFAFWKAIGFFDIAERFDLFSWQEGIIGGFQEAQINPNTKLLAYKYQPPPSFEKNLNGWQSWKDSLREQFKNEFIWRCSSLFDLDNQKNRVPQNILDCLAIVAAELVVNALLWGEESAFVGVQRSRDRVTIAISDAGRGFKSSLAQNKQTKHKLSVESNLEAVLAGTLVNVHEYGLRKAVDAVTELGGGVSISSFDSEINWKKPLWNRVSSMLEGNRISGDDISKLIQLLGEQIHTASKENIEYGYHRIWERGIRGVRVSFDVPLKGR